MTVSSTKSSETFACNGVTTVFVAPFRVLAVDAMRGYLITIATGESTPLTNGTDFTVTGVGGANTTVTTAVAYSSLYRFHVKRSTPRLQETDYRDNDPFPAESHEACLDRLTHITQEDAETLSRALVWPDGETAPVMPSQADRANKVWANNADGDLVFVVPTDGAVGSFAIDLASDASAIKGAGMVGLGASLNYAVGTLGYWVTRVVTDFNVFRWIPPTEWAAILNGTSTYDAASAWASAINAAIASGRPATVTCPTGRYRCDSVLGTFTNVNDLTIDFNGSTLDFGQVQTAVFDRILYITGSYDATAALTANAADLTQTLAVASAGFVAGDWVRVYSNAIWDSTRTSTKIGEINQIDTVPDGVSVTLVMQTQNAYATADAATMQKLTMCRNVHIRCGTIIGPTANDQLGGIHLRLCLESSIQHIATRDIDNQHLRFLDCVLSSVSFCNIQEAREDSQAYGISFMDATQDCQAVHNVMRDVRHSFTTNNSTTSSYGITRRCIVAYNQVYNNIPDTGGGLTGDAIDTHAGCEDITIEHNTVAGAFGSGINFEGRTGTIHGNKVYGATSYGIRLAPYTDAEPAKFYVTDNELETIGDGDGNDYGIVVAPAVNSIASLVIENNRILSTQTCIRINGTAAFPISSFTINGNTVSVWTGGPGLPGTSGIEVNYGSGGTISGNRASGTTRGIEVLDCNHVSISGNYAQIVDTSGSVGYGIRAASVCTYVNMTGNTCKYTAAGIVTTIGVSASAGSSYCGVWSNITSGFTSSASAGGGVGSAAANNI